MLYFFEIIRHMLCFKFSAPLNINRYMSYQSKKAAYEICFRHIAANLKDAEHEGTHPHVHPHDPFGWDHNLAHPYFKMHVL